jgi:hypothetical protein
MMIVLMASPAAGAEGAAHWSVDGEATAAGGYDTNLFLQVAASPDSPTFHSYRGAFLGAVPSLAAALAGGAFRLELRYGADIVQTFGSGRLYIQDAELGLSLPELGPASVRMAVVGGRFDAQQFASDRFWSWGAVVQATVHLADPLRASVLYEISRRQFGDPAAIQVDDDLAQRVHVRVAYLAAAPLELGLGGDYLSLRSSPSDATQPAARLVHWRAAVDAAFTPIATLTLSASAWGGVQRMEGSPTDGSFDDRQAGGAAAILVRVSPALDVMGRYEVLVDRTAAPDSNYSRQVATVGVIGHLPGMYARRTRAARPDPAGDAPATAGRRVRFRLRARGAASVVVIGSWNDWIADGAEQRLQRAPGDGDVWERWVEVPPGRYRYHFLVDGRATRPPGAPAYRADDFGGEDGLLEVEEAAAPAGSSP